MYNSIDNLNFKINKLYEEEQTKSTSAEPNNVAERIIAIVTKSVEEKDTRREERYEEAYKGLLAC